jgi:hypothetical protein
MRRPPLHAALLAALATTPACGPVVGSDDGGSDGGSRGNDTGTTSPTTSPTAASADVTSTPSDAEDEVNSAFEEGRPPDFWDTTPTCPRTFDATPIPSHVSVLVDVSQTMTTQLVDHDLDLDTPAVTRWSMLANHLAEWLPTLTVHSEVSVWSFPSVDANAPPSPNACDVSATHPPFGATADEMIAYLPAPDAVAFAGATPTGIVSDGTTLELGNLPLAPPKHVVLITDGAPNCTQGTDPPELFDAVDSVVQSDLEALHAAGITTHVVAIDVPTGPSGGGIEGDAITDHHATLAALAAAGGTTLHDVADATALDAATNALLRATQSCRLAVPPELDGTPFQIDIGDDRVYYEVPPELCADNWGYTFVTGLDDTVIQMCSGACDSLVTLGNASFVEICVIAE